MIQRVRDPIDRHVSKRLHTLRRNSKLTQDDLAQKVGVTFQQIQKYENGVNRVAAARLYRIAGVLGCEIGAFFEGLKVKL